MIGGGACILGPLFCWLRGHTWFPGVNQYKGKFYNACERCGKFSEVAKGEK